MYSQEEAALLLRDKLIRLQSLYIEQFKRLQHVLKEKRRKFLHTYKQEREMLGETTVVCPFLPQKPCLHSSQTSKCFFSESYRPAMFSIPCC